MSTRCLLKPGASKILDENNELLGFAFVDVTSDGQTQRWILRRKPEWFSIVAADLDVSLLDWKTMVSKPTPDAQGWGNEPKLGLWLPNAIYVIARSVVYSYGAGAERAFIDPPLPLPEPSFPLGVAPGTSAGSTYRQLDLGGREIFQRWQYEQSERRVGYAYAFGGLTKPAQSDAWTSTEYWILFSAYEQAGTNGLITCLKSGRDIPDADPAELHSLVKTDWSSGYTLEVTGCNNYQGLSPPPQSAL